MRDLVARESEMGLSPQRDDRTSSKHGLLAERKRYLIFLALKAPWLWVMIGIEHHIVLIIAEAQA